MDSIASLASVLYMLLLLKGLELLEWPFDQLCLHVHCNFYVKFVHIWSSYMQTPCEWNLLELPHMPWYMYMLMRDAEGRKKEASKVK